METTVVAWHRRIASVQRLSSESARNAFRTLDTLIDDRSHTVVFDGVLSKIDFEIAASEHLAALRRHGLYLYGLPFLVVQQHIDAEIRPIVTPCVAVGVTDMDSSAMVVSQNPAPLVGSYRNYFEEICPISTW
ncbi:hypothetical protein TSH58p_29970 (plasmid) [Azospirillum sp. TSH58]|nr:hypothetical protein [Azospirillum sp. TSH58]AWJ87743.1 hypothetical protein TSH58p_29970 [Azospirillum sp. TSH58]